MNAPPDGYTLLLVSAGTANNATLYDKLNFSLIGDMRDGYFATSAPALATWPS